MKKIFSLFMIMALVFGLSGCGKKEEENYTDQYKVIESSMLNAGKEFYEVNNHLLPEEGDRKAVTLRTLLDAAYLDEEPINPADENTKCNNDKSYAAVKMVDGEYVYSVYLECGNYKTQEED